MEFSEKQTQILSYLNKNYWISENRIFRKFGNIHEWNVSIGHTISKIFSFDEEFCIMQLKFWSENNGLSENDWQLSFSPHKLKIEWSLEMSQDLKLLYGIDNAEKQVILMLSNEIAKETNSNIIKELIETVKTGEEFISVVRCVGYDTTQVRYDQHTFKPKKGFMSMNYNDIANERNTNPFWQDWIRTRKQDKKT